MINLFVIDDHPVVVNGIKSLFDIKTDGIKVTSWAYSAREATTKLTKSKADIIILDLLLPEISGIDYCIYIKENYPEKKVIVLTAETNPNMLYQVWINNADAILSKDCGKDELISTIHSTLDGNRVVGKSVPDFFRQNDNKEKLLIKLTNREKQVLNLLSKGVSRSKAAETLCCNVNAINFHCKNIFKKFDKNNIVQVLEEARNLRIID